MQVSYQASGRSGSSHEAGPLWYGKRPATTRARLDEWRVLAVSAIEDLARVSSENPVAGETLIDCHKFVLVKGGCRTIRRLECWGYPNNRFHPGAANEPQYIVPLMTG